MYRRGLSELFSTLNSPDMMEFLMNCRNKLGQLRNVEQSNDLKERKYEHRASFLLSNYHTSELNDLPILFRLGETSKLKTG